MRTVNRQLDGAEKLRRFLGLIDDYVFSVDPEGSRIGLGLAQEGKVIEAYVLEFREFVLKEGTFPDLARP